MKIDKIKKALKAQNYSDDMIKACLIGLRKPNAEVRYKLKNIVPFEAWQDFREWRKQNGLQIKRGRSKLQEKDKE